MNEFLILIFILSLLLLILLPIHFFLKSLSILAQVAEPSLHELWNCLGRCGEYHVQQCLLHGLFSPPWDIDHLLQEERPEVTFEVSPVFLAGVVVLRPIGHVPDWFYVELSIGLCSWFAMMNGAVVQEEVDLLVSTGTSDIFQEALKLLTIEAIILNGIGEKAMAGADCCTQSLARLVACGVSQDDVLTSRTPSRHLKPSGLEDAFVSKNQVALLVQDLLDVLVQVDGLEPIVLRMSQLLLRGVQNLDLLLRGASSSQDSSICEAVDDPELKSSVEDQAAVLK